MTADNTNPDISAFADDPKNMAKLYRELFTGTALQKNDDDPVHIFIRGLAYLSGINVKADHDLALRLITQAAETGMPMAYEQLVSMYQTGEGVERNYHTAIEWQKKCVDLLRKQAVEQETDKAWGALLIGLERLGDQQKDVGDIRSAKESYQRMLEYALEMRQRGWEARRYLSVTYERLGDICREENDLSGERTWFEKDLEISRALAEESGTVEAHRDLSVTYERLGDICKAEGDLSGAKAWYEKGLEISRGLAEKTETAEARRDLSISYSKLGAICEAEGDLNGAKAWYEKDLEISRALAEESPTVESRRDLSISDESLGDIMFISK